MILAASLALAFLAGVLCGIWLAIDFFSFHHGHHRKRRVVLLPGIPQPK
jgi:hypothetical protein